MKKLLFLCLLGALTTLNANALELSILGGLTNGKPDYAGAENGTALTYGALIGTSGLAFGFETGVLSIGKKHKGALGVEPSGRAWEVPFLVRFTALPLVSFGGGVYYQSYATKPIVQKSSDLGLKLNGRLHLPLAPLTRFLFDLSYKKGFSNLSSSGGDFKNNEIDFLAGLSFGF